ISLIPVRMARLTGEPTIDGRARPSLGRRVGIGCSHRAQDRCVAGPREMSRCQDAVRLGRHESSISLNAARSCLSLMYTLLAIVFLVTTVAMVLFTLFLGWLNWRDHKDDPRL